MFGVVCGLVALLTISDLPWEDIATTIGCSSSRFQCCSKRNDNDDLDDQEVDGAHPRSSDLAANENPSVRRSAPLPIIAAKGTNYHVMDTVWNPDHLRSDTPAEPHSTGVRSPDQRTTPTNVLIQSFTAAVLEKQKQQELDERRVFAVNIGQTENTTSKSTSNQAETMVSWTRQLQEQLKNKNTRETTSASSNRELIHSNEH